MDTWQENMLDSLNSYFEADHDVLGLFLFGSYSRQEYHPDQWSDIDILVIVSDNILNRFFPTTEWLNNFGRLYTYSQSADDFKCTTRACYENFNRLDFIITTKSKVAEIGKWPDVPFYSGVKVIFSRSVVLDEMVAQKQYQQKFPAASEEQFLKMVRDFRFKSMLAVYKIIRGDLLIGLHLAQDLIRDCCVLGMMLRDRAMGTSIHKHGVVGNQLVAKLDVTRKPFTSLGILDSIKESNEVFEKLAYEWSSNFQENRQPLFDWIEQVKADLGV